MQWSIRYRLAIKKTFIMNRKIIILTILCSALLSGVVSWAVVSTNSKSDVAYATGGSEIGHYKFTNSSADVSLPDFTAAAEKAVSAVVNIENVRQVSVGGYGGGYGNDLFDFFFGPQQRQPQQRQPQTREQRSGGSGVIISEDGYIVTNNHVIDGAEKIVVKLQDGQSYTGKLIGTDPSTDIALVKVDAKGLPTLEFGNSDNLKLGEWVLAIGNPMGLSGTVTAGIISAKGRSLGGGQGAMLDIESFIQTDAVVNPGNSGGALVTTNGNLVGINTILKSNTGSYIGYSFAVPSAIVRKVVSDLREFGTVQRAVLGIRYSELSSDWVEQFGKETGVKETEGLYVGEVVEDGAADAAGIKKGDIVVAINDAPVRTSAVLQESLAKLRPGDKVKISVKRDGVLKQFDVTLRNKAGNEELVKKEDVDVLANLGAKFQTPSESLMKKLGIRYGLQVVSMSENGLLAKLRVRPGFVITAINNVSVRSEQDIARINTKIESVEGIYPDGKGMVYQTIN